MKTTVVHLVWVVIGLVSLPIWLSIAFTVMTISSIQKRIKNAALWLINAEQDVQPIR